METLRKNINNRYFKKINTQLSTRMTTSGGYPDDRLTTWNNQSRKPCSKRMVHHMEPSLTGTLVTVAHLPLLVVPDAAYPLLRWGGVVTLTSSYLHPTPTLGRALRPLTPRRPLARHRKRSRLWGQTWRVRNRSHPGISNTLTFMCILIIVTFINFYSKVKTSSGRNWVKSRTTNAWSRPVEAGQNVGIRSKFCSKYV